MFSPKQRCGQEVLLLCIVMLSNMYSTFFSVCDSFFHFCHVLHCGTLVNQYFSQKGDFSVHGDTLRLHFQHCCKRGCQLCAWSSVQELNHIHTVLLNYAQCHCSLVLLEECPLCSEVRSNCLEVRLVYRSTSDFVFQK